MAGNFSSLLIPIRLRSWGVAKRCVDLDLVGQPLPRLGHFGQKDLEPEIARGAGFMKAPRTVTLIRFRGGVHLLTTIA